MIPFDIKHLGISTVRDRACRVLAVACGRPDLAGRFSAPDWFLRDSYAGYSEEEIASSGQEPREARRWYLGRVGAPAIVFHDFFDNPIGGDPIDLPGKPYPGSGARFTWVRVPGIHEQRDPRAAFMAAYSAVREAIPPIIPEQGAPRRQSDWMESATIEPGSADRLIRRQREGRGLLPHDDIPMKLVSVDLHRATFKLYAVGEDSLNLVLGVRCLDDAGQEILVDAVKIGDSENLLRTPGFISTGEAINLIDIGACLSRHKALTVEVLAAEPCAPKLALIVGVVPRSRAS